jgi:hypothetical protein
MANQSRRPTTQQRSAAATQRQALMQAVSAQQEALEDTVSTIASLKQANRKATREATIARRHAALISTALVDVLKATGVHMDPRFARLIQASDEENNQVAMTSNDALSSATRENVNTYGTVPGAANAGVTPDAVTDVATTDVTLSPEPFNSLVDVNAAMPGIDVPSVADAHVNTDVRAGQPSQDVAFSTTNGNGFTAGRKQADAEQTPFAFDGSWADNNDASASDTGSETEQAEYAQGGGKQSARRYAGEVPEAFKKQWDKDGDSDSDSDSDKDDDDSKKESRFVAAMRLVEARKAAGQVAQEASTVLETQALLSSTASIHDMDLEVDVLSRVATAQPRPIPRNLVPTRQATRTSPSLRATSAPMGSGSGSGLGDSSLFD